MKFKNKLAAVITIAASAFLLWLWYALGFNHVDAPLDLIISIIWWCIIAGLIVWVTKLENKRQEKVRTLYISENALFNSEIGMVEFEDADPMQVYAETLSDLDYNFKAQEMTDEMMASVTTIIHTEKFEDDGETWEGEVIFVNDPDTRIAFEDRAELVQALTGKAVSASSTVELPATQTAVAFA